MSILNKQQITTWLLAALLLFAQTVAAAHTHADAFDADSGSVAVHDCPDCTLDKQLNAVEQHSSLHINSEPVNIELAYYFTGYVHLSAQDYLSRAPPF